MFYIVPEMTAKFLYNDTLHAEPRTSLYPGQVQCNILFCVPLAYVVLSKNFIL